ncbi:polyadenylate-binding protein-interacting protein 11-like [Zingiber officinale]|uniref:polyadenylate-binding protein-interacting protein 11-like n=2 Tax=Zingiber officinale TaxID=94328 RepID=UPI001C4C03E5|nr:polyadenylate-binding protein-interacting protein 11-like [Zingiber officinale]
MTERVRKEIAPVLPLAFNIDRRILFPDGKAGAYRPIQVRNEQDRVEREEIDATAPKKFASAIWSPPLPFISVADSQLLGCASPSGELTPPVLYSQLPCPPLLYSPLRGAAAESLVGEEEQVVVWELVPEMAIVETMKGVDLASAVSSSAPVDGVLAPELRSTKDLTVPEIRSHRDASADTFLSTTKDVTASAAQRPTGVASTTGDEGFKREMRDLEELLSKLNPMAQEFVPPSLTAMGNSFGADGVIYPNGLGVGDGVGNGGRRKKNGYGHGRRRMNSRTSMAQRDEVIKRTVYVSDIDHQVTEEQLATLFVHCGQVVDCRMCGDPKSVLRFAFIEFTDEEGAQAALSLSGTVLGFYPVRVLPSKTAIAPVNPTFLPRSDDEREMCSRTVYCTNIDKKVSQADVKLFFESICGEVYRLRLLGDYNHSSRIAFVEFVMAESATAALNCSGVVLGSLSIRVSPSKTPVRPRAPRSPIH